MVVTENTHTARRVGKRYSPHVLHADFSVEEARGIREMEDYLIELGHMDEAERMSIPFEFEPRRGQGGTGNKTATER